MNYSAYSDPTFSFKDEELHLLIHSVTLEINDLSTSPYGRGYEDRAEKLLALREKLESGKYAGCG